MRILYACFGFVLLIVSLFYLLYQYPTRSQGGNTGIKSISQTGPLKEALKTDYLAESLGLASDHPRIIECKEAEARLLSSPLITKANVLQKDPSTLYIDYTVRSPYVTLSDYENIAIDKERFPFPLYPFYPPKKLLALYLGPISCEANKILWNTPLQGEYINLAFEVLSFLENWAKDFFSCITRLDVSHAYDPSLGTREIVLTIEYPSSIKHYIRLTPKNYQKELTRYKVVKEKMSELTSAVFEMRVKEQALIQPIQN